MSLGWYHPKPLPVGSRAPDFTLESTSGPLTLSKELEQGPVVFVFYMGDFGTTCSWVLNKFRDIYGEFKKRDMSFWAIARDPIDMHRRYHARMHFPFPLLSDVNGEVASLYGCLIENHDIYKGMAGRALYVVDSDGYIAYVWAAKEDPAQPPNYKELLDFIHSYRDPK
ncbi:MAG: glutaredoxin-dependent peroxiredoxin [Candidatus Methanomethylophilaceae archaeon]|nr:glutaredoxin-dependent peroxiredoxin [Candidatus Methanomethylophilaceae archaeon]MDI3542339.1 glutaredoxin-dependent peroxiredoxin [Candidatus Methanomethylophilaceae archaeon]HIJ00517.1 redoxin domain-containing protein [Candidatus Methanomethylophilaceae archaeon]